jgi:hypothetical protein
MQGNSFDDTVNSLRRIVTTGAIIAVMLLVGAVVLFALSVLTSLARFTPYGIGGIALVVAAAVLAGGLVWLRGPGILHGAGRGRRPALVTDVLRAPPPAPIRRPVPAANGTAGRLGLESSINLLVEQRRYEDALRHLDEVEAADPALATFCAVKRRAIARRQALGR